MPLAEPSDPPAVEHGGADRYRTGGRGGSVDRQLHVGARAGAEHVRRLGEDVGDVDRRHDPQGDVPVDAARLQVVDGGGPRRGAVGRHVEPAPIDDDGQHVVPRDQVLGQFHRERQVAALVLSDLGATEEHGGARHHALEVDEHPGAGVAGPGEVLAVDPHLLPAAHVPVAPGQRRHRVRERDRGEAAVRMTGSLGAAGVDPAEQPVLVELVDAERRVRAAGLRCPRGDRAPKRPAGQRGSAQDTGPQQRSPREPQPAPDGPRLRLRTRRQRIKPADRPHTIAGVSETAPAEHATSGH